MGDNKERKVLGETEVDNHVKSFENERRLFCILFGKVKNLKLSFQKRFTKKIVNKTSSTRSCPWRSEPDSCNGSSG